LVSSTSWGESVSLHQYLRPKARADHTAPFGATQVEVEDSPEPHTVPALIDAGDSFVAMVRGRGVRITATAMPSMIYVYSDFEPA